MGLAKNHGFTLMEILTVIVIIVILAGLLTPAISKAQRQAKRVECMNNLRQIGMALQQYALDNNGAFPPDLTTLTTVPAGDTYLPDSPTISGGTTPAILVCSADNGGYTESLTATMAAATAGTPLVQCPNLSHPGNTRNVLYGDGHVGSSAAGGGGGGGGGGP